MRKCKKIVENIFFIPFSGTQPNTKNISNQTLKNNLFFKKYFHLKIFYAYKIFCIQPNTTLTKLEK